MGVVAKLSKVTLKSDALAEKSQFLYEWRRNPKNYVYRLKNWSGRDKVQSDIKKWRISWENAISVRKAPYSKKLRI